ncbi:MAG: hypothetical protein PHF50_04660 [Patescibacteria group bacterium]|nr:hypothetical protein [Patescibacteria group bacterium]
MFNKIMDWCLGTQEKRKAILWAVVVLVLALLILTVFNGLFSGSTKNFGRLSDWADFSKYQAVFLSNGQVYFGKVMDANNQTLVLEKIYYLRTAGNLQISDANNSTSTPAADNFSLIKLGNELHGPEDKMSINLSQVLFVEDLKSDSKVVEAIRAYEAKK